MTSVYIWTTGRHFERTYYNIEDGLLGKNWIMTNQYLYLLQ